jgi:UDP-glucuronate decarboxylase
MSIIITGGAGFLGRSLIEFLININSNFHIIVIDNFITSDHFSFNDFRNEINQRFNKNIIDLFQYDISKDDFIERFLQYLSILNNDPIDIKEIYHLASLASPPFYKTFPLQTLDVGYLGTKNILNLAKLYKSKVLFSSTSEVYGDALISPQSEKYYGNVNCFGERSCYDISKRIAETLCYTYIKQFNMDIKIARIFNSYGPHMLLNDGRIITECIRHLINDTTLIIYGDGTQTRSCCFASDTVKMLYNLMQSNINFPINIGNDNEMSINDTVKLINKIWNQMYNKNDTLSIKYKPLTQNDPLQRKPCLILNKQHLGKIEYTSFEQGIKQTITYFMNLKH